MPLHALDPQQERGRNKRIRINASTSIKTPSTSKLRAELLRVASIDAGLNHGHNPGIVIHAALCDVLLARRSRLLILRAYAKSFRKQDQFSVPAAASSWW